MRSLLCASRLSCGPSPITSSDTVAHTTNRQPRPGQSRPFLSPIQLLIHLLHLQQYIARNAPYSLSPDGSARHTNRPRYPRQRPNLQAVVLPSKKPPDNRPTSQPVISDDIKPNFLLLPYSYSILTYLLTLPYQRKGGVK